MCRSDGDVEVTGFTLEDFISDSKIIKGFSSGKIISLDKMCKNHKLVFCLGDVLSSEPG